tara:strand:- start:403 stop:1191 length:789 start_codon:yes stop_codon:yes gene_type:complete
MKNIIINGYNSYIASIFYNKYKNKLKILNYKKDINDIKLFKIFLKKKKFEYFIHFAGLSRKKCVFNKRLCSKTNFLAIKNKIDYLNTLKNKPMFIFISSSHVYDYSDKKIKEEFKKKPKDLYGELKLKSENYIRKNYNNYCILRLFNIYGKDQPSSYFVSDINKKILDNREIVIDNSIRDFINAKYVAKIIYFIISNNINDIINIGTGKGLSLLSIVKKIAQINKKKALVKIRKSSTKLVADISLLKSYGFKLKNNEKNFNI